MFDACVELIRDVTKVVLSPPKSELEFLNMIFRIQNRSRRRKWRQKKDVLMTSYFSQLLYSQIKRLLFLIADVEN